jgi:hypothetical protein
VDCTGGRKAVGGGYVLHVVSGNSAEITVTQNRATDDDTWTVTGVEDDDGNISNWTIEAYVICMFASASP